jgi:autotransporter-associated beta strand protein
MRKIFTKFFCVVLMMLGSQTLFAVDTYKKYHIHEDFSGNALPSGWTTNSTNSSSQTTNVYGGAGSTTWADEMLTISGSGGGNRGMEIFFPTPQSNPEMDGHKVINMELDWTINAAEVGAKNALGLVFMDANRTKDTPLPIFGLYLAGTDGFFHYWNLDTQGPEAAPGAVFATGNGGGGFMRRLDSGNTNDLNASTVTTISYTAGHTYHITAAMNFTTHQIESLTITDVDVPENTGTILNQPFIDPKANNLGVLAIVNTRGPNETGVRTNGNNANFTVYFDNLDIYVNEILLGRADVTINYKDRDGATVKASRVIPGEPFTSVYKLLASDKERVIEGGFYYAYDASATHTANASKGEDGESVTVADGGVSLDVIFKKSEITSGTFVWTGADGWNWNELENNFSVNNGANISFQAGNGVALSKTDAANKEIVLDEIADLGDSNMTISAEGYAISGTGRITGTGALTIDVPTILGVNNQLEGGAIISTTETIHVKHANAARKFKVADNTNLKLEAEANFSTPIEGAGGVLNIDAVSDYHYTSAITNVSTVNIKLSTRGRLKSDTWSDRWIATVPENTQINVINNVEDGKSAGLGVDKNTLAKVKVNLGDSTRLLRHYNENNTGTDTLFIGELNGTAASIIEGGFIDGRTATYAFGGLNTDAVFEGIIRPFFRGDTISITKSKLNLLKIGTGTWTLKGNAEFGGTFTVQEGTLEFIGNTVGADTSQIVVNAGATLKGAGATIGSVLTTIKEGGVLAGIFHFNNSLLLDENSSYKPVVNSFDENDYDRITADGGIAAIGTLDITVNKAIKGKRITLLASADPNFYGCEFAQVLVNGVDITANTETTEDAEFVWFPETSELLSLVDKNVGIQEVPAATVKTIKAVKYYDITGRPLHKEVKGFVIKQIIYDDNSVDTQKTFIFNH